MHPTEGDLRAYNDDALSDAEQEWIAAHLTTCTECQQQADQLRQRAVWTESRLALLAPERQPLSVGAARARLAAYPNQKKETQPMRTLPIARQVRPVWSALAAAAMLLIALMFPPVRALATDFLGLFRVQQIEVVEVTTGDFSEYMGPIALFERMFSENVQVETRGEQSDVPNAESASALAAFPVRLPTAATGERQIRVQEGAQLTLTIDPDQVGAVLRELEISRLALPESLDGEQVVIDIPQAVTTLYGACQNSDDEADSDEPCVGLLQLPSPTISAPPELDVNLLGAAFLQIMGMSEEEAARFSQQVDWATTLVLPIPGDDMDYEEVQVDGTAGALIEQRVDEEESRYMLLWVRDGIVYALRGAQSADEALTIANSLE